jgi:signal transduction histidine kinase
MAMLFLYKKIVGLTAMLLQKKYTLVFTLLLLPFVTLCQQIVDSNYVAANTIKDSLLITNKTLLFIDSNETANTDNIATQKFVPLQQYLTLKQRMRVPARLIDSDAWLQIGIANTGANADTFYFLPGWLFDDIKVYQHVQNGKAGFYENASHDGFCKMILAPATKAVYYIRLQFCHQENNTVIPILVTAKHLDYFKKVPRVRDEDMNSVGYITGGMLLIIMVLITVNFFLTGRKEFLYYLAYVTCNFLLIVLTAYYRFRVGSFNSLFFGYLDLVLLVMSSVFYFAFTRYFLDTKNNFKTLHRAFKITEVAMLVVLLVFTVMHYITGPYVIELFLENLMKVVLLCVGIFYIVIALRQNQRLLTYLAIGSVLNITFAIISLVIIWLKIPNDSIYKMPIFYYDVGTVCAVSFFLLGLTYKNRKELVERIKEQAALKLDVERKVMENQIAVIKAQQEERNRISADMHDDLGAGMTTIRLYSELAKNKMGGVSMPEIEKISSSANELLTKMNAIIWSMSSSNDSLGNMVAYIRSYTLEYFEGTGITCNVSIPEDLPNIVVTGEIRRNVFLVVKEALHNILKHSKATVVTITLEKVPDGLKLYIHDNGVGIDFEKLRQFGNGLKNMKKRMADVGVSFTIENKDGTLITLHRVITGF